MFYDRNVITRIPTLLIKCVTRTYSPTFFFSVLTRTMVEKESGGNGTEQRLGK